MEVCGINYIRLYLPRQYLLVGSIRDLLIVGTKLNTVRLVNVNNK